MDLYSTEVLIDGTVYHLSSREDEAYLQKVASYLSDKIGMIKKDRGYGHLSPEYQSILIQLNLADDYFKEQARSAKLEEEISSLEKESYNLKHELVTLQMKLDSLQAELDEEKAKKKTTSRRPSKSGAKANDTDAENSEKAKKPADEKSQSDSALTEEAEKPQEAAKSQKVVKPQETAKPQEAAKTAKAGSGEASNVFTFPKNGGYNKGSKGGSGGTKH